MMGTADAMNASSKMREGWEPVKLADHPEMQLFADPNARFKDCVEVGGLLLCKIPEEFVNQRNAYYNRQTQNQTDAVDNNFMKENDARMPLFKEKSRDLDEYDEGEDIQLLIDLDDYTDKEKEHHINTYGYTLYEPKGNTFTSVNIFEQYAENANWIIAECIFEQESGLY
jgi:hypothetical protein